MAALPDSTRPLLLGLISHAHAGPGSSSPAGEFRPGHRMYVQSTWQSHCTQTPEQPPPLPEEKQEAM